MSLTATLIAFASGLAAKVKIAPDEEVERLRLRVWKLEHDLCAAENARDEAEVRLEAVYADNARQRRYQGQQEYAAMQNEINGRNAMAYAQQQQALQAQYNAQHEINQQMQAYNGLQGLGPVLGAQCLQMPAHWDCTCIPDRASALRQR
jgi:hypothetical protein